MTNKRLSTTLVLLAGALLCAGPASAQTSQACASAKQKALGKTASSVLNCYSKAAKLGAAVETACIQKAKDKWTFPAKGAFQKAELKGGCALEGQNQVLEGRCSNDATATCNGTLQCAFGSCTAGHCATPPPGATVACTVNADCTGTCGGRNDDTEGQGLYDLVVDENLSVLNTTADGLADNVVPLLVPNPTASKCQSDKLKSTGKLAAGLLGCWSKASKSDIPVDQACLAKTLSKHSSAFSKSDLGTCATHGDAGLIEVNVTTFVERAVQAIPRRDGCGNGVVLLPETCDDGNTFNADNCPSDCNIAQCTPNSGSDAPHTVSFTSAAAVAAIKVFVDYPEDKISILGSGSAIPSGEIDGILGDPFTASSFNDLDHGIIGVLAEGTGGDFGNSGSLFTVHYETCSGAGAATAGDFTCTVLEAADAVGKPLTGVTCSVN
jgi:cysteine-rich repeat protein